MAALFREVFHRPLLNALVLLTGIMPFHDLGFSVIVLTIVVRFLMFPFSHGPMMTQHRMRAIEPELQKIKESGDREAQARETMALYKRHGINPFAGILSLFVQIPLFLSLYWVFSRGLAIDPKALYSFVSLPTGIHTLFLGFFDLTHRSIVFAVLAGLSQFTQMKLSRPPGPASAKGDFNKALSFQMTYGMPFIIFFAALSFPAAVSLYWTTSNIFSTVHEGFVRRKVQRAAPLHEARDNQNSRDDSGPASPAGMLGVR